VKISKWKFIKHFREFDYSQDFMVSCVSMSPFRCPFPSSFKRLRSISYSKREINRAEVDILIKSIIFDQWTWWVTRLKAQIMYQKTNIYERLKEWIELIIYFILRYRMLVKFHNRRKYRNIQNRYLLNHMIKGYFIECEKVCRSFLLLYKIKKNDSRGIWTKYSFL